MAPMPFHPYRPRKCVKFGAASCGDDLDVVTSPTMLNIATRSTPANSDQRRRRHPHPLVVRVNVVHVVRRDHLVLHEHRRRHRTAMEDVEGELEDLLAVL